MTCQSPASDVLAPRYALTCNSEERASALLATQKRREDKSPIPPSQDMEMLVVFFHRPNQAMAVQNLRLSMVGEAETVIPCSHIGSGGAGIGMAPVKSAGLKRNRVALEPIVESLNLLKPLQIRHTERAGGTYASA